MGESIEVTIHIDKELDFSVVKSVLLGSSVADLKELLAKDDPTGGTQAQDITLALSLPGASRAAAALKDDDLITLDTMELFVCVPHECEVVQVQASDELAAIEALADAAPDPCEYRVMQGPLFKKPGSDPAGNKIIQLTRKVGSTVKTSGRIWQGTAGGEWVELDSQAEKPGWLLVEGPGFDIRGPLLEKIVADDEPSMVLSLYSAVSKKSYGEICAKPSESVSLAQSWIKLRTGGKHKADKIWCQKATPTLAEGDKFIKAMSPSLPTDTFKSMQFKDGDTVVFVVVNPDFSFSDE